MPLSPEQTEEISAQREQTAITRRVVSAGMEEKLYTAFQVLDHGFVSSLRYQHFLKKINCTLNIYLIYYFFQQ